MATKTLARLFESPIIMDLFIKTYLQEYAPAGYDTKVEITLLQNYQDWQENKVTYKVKITRLESCD